MLTFWACAFWAFKMNLRQAMFVLLGCGLICFLVVRNFHDLAFEAKESQKPLLEQERELVLDFKVQKCAALVLVTIPWWPGINQSHMGYILLYLSALLPLQLLRRIRRLQHVRRELSAQSTLRRHRLMGGV
jgi:hypothetical protein